MLKKLLCWIILFSEICLAASAYQTVPNITALRTLTTGQYLAILVDGYNTKGDGGGGIFYWNGTSTATLDNCTIFRPSSDPATGRWIRAYENPIPANACGITGDGTTNDATSLQAAINYSSSSKIPILFKKGIFNIASTQIEMKSHSSLIGVHRDSTIFLTTSADTVFNFASTVTGASLSNIGIYRATTISLTKGIRIGGTYINLENISVKNIHCGLQGDKTSQFVNIRSYKHFADTGLAAFSIFLNGVNDWNISDINLIGQTTAKGIDKGIAFQNGGTVDGCINVTIDGLISNYTQAYGIGGSPDDNKADAYTSYDLPIWILYLKPTGYTSAISVDIGDTIFQAGTARGVLLAYDNTRNPKVWVMGRIAGTTANTAVTLRNISAGTGAGTTIVNNDQIKAPTTTSNKWTNISSNYALSALIGHGFSLDACFSTHVTNFSCKFNGMSGGYIGDNLSYGSTISNGDVSYNLRGIEIAGSAISTIDNVDIHDNSEAGIISEPIANNLDKNIQYTKVSNCKIYRNSRAGTLSIHSGIGGNFTNFLFQGNRVFENYNRGLGMAGGTDNYFVDNEFIDNGWRDTGAAVVIGAIYIEGVSRRNVFEQNLITSRTSPSSLYRGIQFVTNSDSNIVRNNWIYNFTDVAITDDGIANQDWDNVKTKDPSTLANGTGNIARKQSPIIYELMARRYSTTPALVVEDSSTAGGVTSKFLSAPNTNLGLEPFQRVIGIYNRHADYSTDMVVIKDTGSGGVNATNGSFLNIQSGANNVLKVMTDTVKTSGQLFLTASGKGLLYQAGPKDLAGSGSPEASITATVGSTYRRNDGTNSNTIFYSKTSGSGNTGWTPIALNNTIPRMLHFSTTAVANVGTGEDDLISFSLAGANLVNNGDSYKSLASGTFAASINNKRLRAKFGATTIFDSGDLTITAATDWSMAIEIIRATATTQKAVVTLNTSSATLSAYCDYTTPGETLSSSSILKITGEATADNDITQELGQIIYQPSVF